MVKQMSQAGLFDWLVQRVTAILIGVYVVFLITYIYVDVDYHTLKIGSNIRCTELTVCWQSMHYADWHRLYTNIWMKIATVIVAISVMWHAWIGLWTVFTDYVKVKPVRLLLEVGVILLLLAYLVWILEILWR